MLVYFFKSTVLSKNFVDDCLTEEQLQTKPIPIVTLREGVCIAYNVLYSFSPHLLIGFSKNFQLQRCNEFLQIETVTFFDRMQLAKRI